MDAPTVRTTSQLADTGYLLKLREVGLLFAGVHLC